jgi:hypothetical protein
MALAADTTLYTILVEAINVAFSACLFSVSLVDATFDSYNSRPKSASSLLSYLEFKQSSDLSTAAVSLLLPLSLLRVLQLLQDLRGALDLDWGRRILVLIDAGLLALSVLSMARVFALEEAMVQGLLAEHTPWSEAMLLGLGDSLKLGHLASLGLTGLLLIVSLIKLSARSEIMMLQAAQRPAALAGDVALAASSPLALPPVDAALKAPPLNDTRSESALHALSESALNALSEFALPENRQQPKVRSPQPPSPELLAAAAASPPPLPRPTPPANPAQQLQDQGWAPLRSPAIPNNAKENRRLDTHVTAYDVAANCAVGVITFVIVFQGMQRMA